MIIKVKNDLHEQAPRTRLTSPEQAGTTVYRVENTTALTNGWAIQLGETGEEQTEVLIGTATNIGTITGAASNFAHPADTPVYFIKYDQVVFGSASGTTGTTTTITGGSVTYQADSEYTIYDDTNGTTGVYYRTSFRNTALDVQTSQSDWISSAGYDYYSLANMRERVREKLWDSDYLNDSTIDNWINEWREELVNGVIQVNEDYALGTEAVAFGTDGLGTMTAANATHIRRVWVSYNGQDKYNSVKMNYNDFQPNQIFSSAHPYHYVHGDNIIGVKPSESGGTAEVAFYKFGTTLSNETDNLPIPMRSYTKSFVDYGMAMASYKDGKNDLGDRFMASAERAKQEFIQNIAPRDRSGPTMIDLVEPISGQDGFLP